MLVALVRMGFHVLQDTSALMPRPPTTLVPLANILVQLLRVARVVPVVITTLTPSKQHVPMAALEDTTAPLAPRRIICVLKAITVLICHRLTMHVRRASIRATTRRRVLIALADNIKETAAITTATLAPGYVFHSLKLSFPKSN